MESNSYSCSTDYLTLLVLKLFYRKLNETFWVIL